MYNVRQTRVIIAIGKLTIIDKANTAQLGINNITIPATITAAQTIVFIVYLSFLIT